MVAGSLASSEAPSAYFDSAPPENVKELQRALGLFVQLGRVIHEYDIIAPMTPLEAFCRGFS